MILEWIQTDAMARMRMTGVVPTSLIVSCITWDLLLVYYRVKVNIIPPAAFLDESNNDEQPLERRDLVK
jgi:hypothetical protein